MKISQLVVALRGVISCPSGRSSFPSGVVVWGSGDLYPILLLHPVKINNCIQTGNGGLEYLINISHLLLLYYNNCTQTVLQVLVARWGTSLWCHWISRANWFSRINIPAVLLCVTKRVVAHRGIVIVHRSLAVFLRAGLFGGQGFGGVVWDEFC